MLSIRRCALMCLIGGAHFLLIYLISVSDRSRGVRRPEEALATLFFVDVPEPNDTQPSTRTSLTPNPSSNNRAARESTLTPPLEIEEAEGEIKEDDVRVDWYAEASRVAADVIRRVGEQEKIRSFDAGPAGTAEAFAP